MTQEEIENQILENGYGYGIGGSTATVLVCGMIAVLIMIMAYKYNQKRKQKYSKCELLPENDGKGPSINYVATFSEIFDPLPPW